MLSGMIMREIVERLLIVILVIVSIYILIERYVDESNKDSCLDSEYKTTDYKVILGVLYCKDAGDGYQVLRKKYVSDHMKEHKANW